MPGPRLFSEQGSGLCLPGEDTDLTGIFIDLKTEFYIIELEPAGEDTVMGICLSEYVKSAAE